MAVRVRIAPSAGRSAVLRLDVAADGPDGGRWWSMEVQRTPALGRHVIASRELAAGDVVCAAPVHALSVLEEWKKRVCACCFKVAPGRLSLACPSCEQAFYCDEACRAAHSERGGIGSVRHALVCPALRRFPALKKLGKDNMAMLRLMLEVLAARHTRGGEASASFEELEHHPPVYDSPREAALWAKASHLLREAVACCEWCPWSRTPESGGGEGGEEGGDGGTSAPPPTDAELHALLSRLDSNCFGCYQFDGGPVIGHGCFLAAAVFNHSCDPNCFATSGVDTMLIETQEAVAEGDELTIAYVDVNLPRGARQKHLRACYHFDCACPRCVREASASAPRQKLSYQQKRRGGPKQKREENAGTQQTPSAPQAGGAAAQQQPKAKAKPHERAERKAKPPDEGVPWFEALG